MDKKLNYLRFVLCTKPHGKRPIRREISIFKKVSKNSHLLQNSKEGPRQNFEKWLIFWSNFGRLKKLEIHVLEKPKYYRSKA